MQNSSPASHQPATILVVDDEPSLRATVQYNLVREGYTVKLAADGPEALSLARSERPDAIVLDVMLPGLDGFDVCRILRAESNVPILLLSARGEELDRVLGLEFGADDYLTKPFAMRELLARIRALLRRARMTPVISDALPHTVGSLTIDPARHEISLGGTPLTLKPMEFDLLRYLALHPNTVLSRDRLLRDVWDYDYTFDTRTVDVHIRSLRSKIEVDPSQPRYIETVRGVGYRFVPDED
ncbi:MAG TPA: response regulator transcription factor [Thermomicrobiales bacterium]|nr:response regulator transcription factor [Thermomicrobiales bacterium]